MDREDAVSDNEQIQHYSTAHTTTLELLVENAHNAQARIPITVAETPGDWCYGGGHALWTVEGTRLLDGSFDLYPLDQLSTVIATLELIVSKREGSTNVVGSILWLSVRPIDRTCVEISVSDNPANSRPRLSRLSVTAVRAPVVRDTLRDIEALLKAPAFFIAPPRPTLSTSPTPRFPEVFEQVRALRAAGKHLLSEAGGHL
jgi:hypothetical protein